MRVALSRRMLRVALVGLLGTWILALVRIARARRAPVAVAIRTAPRTRRRAA